MPRVNIYIREEDEELWASIKDRPLFIHNALQIKDAYLKLKPVQKKILKTELNKVADKIDSPYCEHGFFKGRCAEGCK